MQRLVRGNQLPVQRTEEVASEQGLEPNEALRWAFEMGVPVTVQLRTSPIQTNEANVVVDAGKTYVVRRQGASFHLAPVSYSTHGGGAVVDAWRLSVGGVVTQWEPINHIAAPKDHVFALNDIVIEVNAGA